MSPLRLFRIRKRRHASRLSTTAVTFERSFETLIERNLREFLDVQYLASEYATGRLHGDRIDTLGVDRRGAPVIIEYKRTTAGNLLSQGLYYLDWLEDHHAEFRQLVEDRCGRYPRTAINWSA